MTTIILYNYLDAGTPTNGMWQLIVGSESGITINNINDATGAEVVIENSSTVGTYTFQYTYNQNNVDKIAYVTVNVEPCCNIVSPQFNVMCSYSGCTNPTYPNAIIYGGVGTLYDELNVELVNIFINNIALMDTATQFETTFNNPISTSAISANTIIACVGDTLTNIRIEDAINNCSVTNNMSISCNLIITSSYSMGGLWVPPDVEPTLPTEVVPEDDYDELNQYEIPLCYRFPSTACSVLINNNSLPYPDIKNDFPEITWSNVHPSALSLVLIVENRWEPDTCTAPFVHLNAWTNQSPLPTSIGPLSGPFPSFSAISWSVNINSYEPVIDTGHWMLSDSGWTISGIPPYAIGWGGPCPPIFHPVNIPCSGPPPGPPPLTPDWKFKYRFKLYQLDINIAAPLPDRTTQQQFELMYVGNIISSYQTIALASYNYLGP